MLLHRLVGGTTTKFQSFLSYSLESKWCVEELTLAQVTRDQGAEDFQPFATWGDGRAAAHQPCRLQGQERAGLGVGDWAATGHRQTQTRNSWFNTSATSLRFWMMYPHILWYSWPPSCFSHTTSSLSSGWYCMWFFSFLHPSFFQFVSIYLRLWRQSGYSCLPVPTSTGDLSSSGGRGTPVCLICPHTGDLHQLHLQRSQKRWSTNPQEISKKPSEKTSAWLVSFSGKNQMLAFLRFMRGTNLWILRRFPRAHPWHQGQPLLGCPLWDMGVTNHYKCFTMRETMHFFSPCSQKQPRHLSRNAKTNEQNKFSLRQTLSMGNCRPDG